MTPLISIVCGTYNRLNTLKEMLDSIEATIPPTIPYEIVIVDNASTDGTWQWLTEQSDRFNLVLLDMGKPVGAVKAFTEGAYKASGKYVLLATDDITFPENAIMTALAHIEDNPKCGAVAFAHDKQRHGFFADTHRVRDLQGNVMDYPYPQISLVRKSIGDKCGWWGGRHDIMKDAFTYGGDNFLGAQLVEHGYSVNVVMGARNIERVFEDEPRQMNRARHKEDAELYYKCFPRFPQLKLIPDLPLESRQIRIMYVNHFSQGNERQRKNKRGLREALARIGLVWEVDYTSYGKQAPENLCAITKAFQPHLILMQVHKADIINNVAIRAMRNEAPNTIIVNRIGDVYDKLHLDTQQSSAWRELDALLVVNGSVIDKCWQAGIKAYHWSHSYETVDTLPDMPAHDVVFLGNGYDQFRKQLGATLNSLPYDVGIYGGGHTVPTKGNTHYDFAQGRGLYANAKIAISDQHFNAYAYTSNRFWEIMAGGGALILHQKTDGFDKLTGLSEGTHYIAWSDFNDLKQKIAYWLADENQNRRRQIVRNAKRQADSNHSFDARVKQLLMEILPNVAKAQTKEQASA